MLCSSVVIRYRPTNLLLYGITGGPKEANHEGFQNFAHDWVDDLLLLYNHGIVKTRKSPNGSLFCFVTTKHITYICILGRRVRVILLAVCCDHPALCKVCGFADNRSKFQFCPKCKITHADLATENGVTIDGLYFIYFTIDFLDLDINS